MSEIRTIPTSERIGHEFLGGLTTKAALFTQWARLQRRARATAKLLVREGRYREAASVHENTRLGIEGNQNLAVARGLLSVKDLGREKKKRAGSE